MPATAGKVRMPANNRMSSSVSLRTNSMWANVIGDDKYAPQQTPQETQQADADAGNAYDDFKALLSLARLRGQQGDEGDRGNWKGKRPLKGVFPSPQYGYDGNFFGVGEKAEAEKGKGAIFGGKRASELNDDDISSTSSEDEGDSDSDGERKAPAKEKKRKREKKDKKEKKKKKKKKEKKKKEKKRRKGSDSDSD